MKSPPDQTTAIAAMRSLKELVQQAEAFTLSPELSIRLAEVQHAVETLKGTTPQLLIRTETIELETRRLWNQYQDYLVQIENERKAAKEPLLRAGHLIDDRAKVHSTAAESAKKLLETALREWKDTQDREAAEAQRKIDEENRKRQARENKLAEKKGIEPRNVTVQAVVQTPPKSVSVDLGDKSKTQTWISNWKWRIQGIPDPSTITADQAVQYGIPLSLFRLDASAIDKLVRAMKTAAPVPGSKIEAFDEKYLRRT